MAFNGWHWGENYDFATDSYSYETPFNGWHWGENYDFDSGSYTYQSPLATPLVTVPDPSATSVAPSGNDKEDKPDPLQEVLDSLRASIDAYQTSVLKAQADEADLTRTFNAEQARLAREFSAEETEKQRKYQSEREDTAYQRLVKDLSAAGLNPILAFGQGGSVSTSTGSYPVAQSFSSSGQQANLASAKNADKLDLDDLLPVLVFPLLQSILDTVKDKGIKFSLFG